MTPPLRQDLKRDVIRKRPTTAVSVVFFIYLKLRPAMEVNRDEAERCIDIATAALTNNQAEKAVRFLEKAQKLFPTDKARGKRAA